MFQRVLVVWDGGEPPAGALDLARNVARRFDADVVCATTDVSPAPHQPPVGENEIVQLPSGRPAEAVRDYAHQHGFDLIVVSGSRQTSELQRIADLATIPVLIAPVARIEAL
jgi:nucleotide-binding universal stress UspA family protein